METTSAIKAKCKIKNNFYICFSGIFFCFSAFRSVIDLQSSINIEHGLGPVSGAIINATAVISSLTIAPLILKRYGAKKSLILSEIFYIFYVMGNFYAIFATMIPVSVLAGIAEALIFPTMSVYSVYFATNYAQYGSKSVSEYVNIFAGKFFGITYFTRVVGNMLSYAVMHLDGDKAGGNLKNSSEINNTSLQTDEMNLGFCGTNDCQDPDVTSVHIENYVSDRKTLYILLSLFVLLLVISLLIHCFATQDVQSQDHLTRQGNQLDENVNMILKDNTLKSKQTRSSNELDENINMIPKDNSLKSEQTGSSSSISNTDEDNLERTAKKCEKIKLRGFTCETLRATVHQIKSPKQLLLMPIIIYCGLEVTIMVSEISRAYVSCVLGVQQLGLANVVYGTVATASAYLNGQVASKIGRNVPFASAFVVDMAALVVCYKWIPTHDTSWIIFVICGCFGYTSGVWQPLTNAMYVDYFKKEREVAYTVWTMLVCSGITIQFTWSTLLCVDQKLIANMTILCIGVLLYGIAELVYQRKPASKDGILEIPLNADNDIP